MLTILPGCVALDHVASGELRELEDAGEVDLHDFEPVFEGVLDGVVADDGAGVVDEDVDVAEGGFGFGEELLGGRWWWRGRPGGRGRVPPSGGDGGGGVGGGAAVAVDGDGGSGLRERGGDGGAEAGGGSGDEGDFVVEAEEVEDVGC